MSAASPSAMRRVIYEVFRDHGRPPSPGELSALLGAPPKEVSETLQRLADAHAVVLGPGGDWIRMAHPFSGAPMNFVVRPTDPDDERLWWGGCAWDSFGLCAALRVDVQILTRCPGCGADLEVRAGPDTAPVGGGTVHFLVPARDWWSDVINTCSHIRLFCSGAHVHDWTQETGSPVGAIVEAERVWELSRRWYGDRLEPDFTPHSTAYNQQLLTELGLVGDFWQLP